MLDWEIVYIYKLLKLYGLLLSTPLDPLLNLYHHLSEILLLPLVLVGIGGLFETERLLVHDGMDVVGFDGTVHGLQLRPGPDEDSTDDAACR